MNRSAIVAVITTLICNALFACFYNLPWLLGFVGGSLISVLFILVIDFMFPRFYEVQEGQNGTE